MNKKLLKLSQYKYLIHLTGLKILKILGRKKLTFWGMFSQIFW